MTADVDIISPEILAERAIPLTSNEATAYNELIGFSRSPGNRHVPANILCQEVKLYPSYAEVKIGKVTKHIALEDLQATLNSLLGVTSNQEVVALPFNCFLYSQSKTRIELSCYYPEKMMEISHISRENGRSVKYNLPFPNTIISHSLNKRDSNWVVERSKFFCTNKSVSDLSDSQVLFTPNFGNGIWSMPFPNFYNDGNMCYGSNTMPSSFSKNNLRGLDYYYQVIFRSPFNDDLGLSSVGSHSSPQLWFKFLSELKTEKFPYKNLRARI